MNSNKTPAALKREKRDAEIRALHHSEPDLSLRAIADRVGCSSPTTVKKVLDAEAAGKPEVALLKITGGGVKVTKSTAVIITKPPRVTTLKLVSADADTNGEAPGGVTSSTPGQTPAVAQALNNARTEHDGEQFGEAVGTELEPIGDAAVAEYEAEQIDYASAARALDTELRGLARIVAENVARFKELINDARDGRVYEALGFSSWTTYVADVIGKEMGRLDVDTRRDLVALLSGEGVSNRVIGDAVGVDETTVRRDKEQLRHDAAPDGEPIDAEPEKVTGRDGKRYPLTKKREQPPTPPDPEPEPHLLDAQLGDGDDEVEPPTERDEDEDDTARQARDHHDHQVRELYWAAEHLEDAAEIFQYELDNDVVLSPEEVRELAERMEPTITKLLVWQDALEELGAGVS